MTPSLKTPAPGRIPQGRVKLYTPPIVPGHFNQYYQYGYGKRSAVEKEKPKEMDYFAGAKFDCLPSVSSLPTPPPEWTIPVIRSQSQPSSPVTTGVRIDINSLFLTPQVRKGSSKESTTTITTSTKKQNEIDTHFKTAEGQKTKKEGDFRKNIAKDKNSRINKDQANKAIESPPKMKAGSKPIDIARPIASHHHQQMYPHLTEHLKCLLKVQG